MKKAVYTLLLAMSGGVVCAGERVRIGVMVEEPEEMGERVRAAFRAETGRLMAMPGVEVVWRRLGGRGSEEVFDRVVVMRLRGRCDGGAAAADGASLGMTHISEGRVLPFVEIDCGVVRGVAGRRASEGEALGRALALVAAHELHHAIAGSVAHDEEGVAKASFSRADLTTARLAFSVAAMERMRAGLGLENRGGGQQSAGAEERAEGELVAGRVFAAELDPRQADDGAKH